MFPMFLSYYTEPRELRDKKTDVSLQYKSMANPSMSQQLDFPVESSHFFSVPGDFQV